MILVLVWYRLELLAQQPSLMSHGWRCARMLILPTSDFVEVIFSSFSKCEGAISQFFFESLTSVRCIWWASEKHQWHQQKISLDQLQWMSVVGLFIGPKKSFVRILLTRKWDHSAAVSMGEAKPTAEALISLKLWVQDDLEVSALLKPFTILWLSRWVEMPFSSHYDVNFLLVHLFRHL